MATAFDNLLTVFGMHIHVNFLTHISGSSLDPVLSDFPESLVQCSALGNVGTSDHTAILTTIQTALMQDEGVSRVIRQWDKGNWEGIKPLNSTNWKDILTGSVEKQTKLHQPHSQGPASIYTKLLT